jgi:hypothetical protein
MCLLKLPALLIAAALACPKFAEAQTTIKIGVLTDMSGLYADFSGQGSVESAKMAAEDFMAAMGVHTAGEGRQAVLRKALHKDAVSDVWVNRCCVQITGALAALERDRGARKTPYWF